MPSSSSSSSPSAVEAFLQALQFERGAAGSTLRAYRSELSRLQAFLAPVALEQASSEALVDWLEARRSAGVGPHALRRTRSVMREFSRWLRRDLRRPLDPAERIEAPRVPLHAPKALEPSRTERLLQHPPAHTGWLALRNRALLELAYGSGLRASELAGLRISLVDFTQASALIEGKGARQRLVPLSEPSREALLAWLHEGRPNAPGSAKASDAMFISAKGGPLTPNGLWRMVRRAAQQAGLSGRVSPHVLRHSFATDLVDNGANLRAVQMLLGHESLTTTTVYLRPSARRLRALHKKHHPRG